MSQALATLVANQVSTPGMQALETSFHLIDEEAGKLAQINPELVIRRLAELEHCWHILAVSLVRFLPKTHPVTRQVLTSSPVLRGGRLTEDFTTFATVDVGFESITVTETMVHMTAEYTQVPSAVLSHTPRRNPGQAAKPETPPDSIEIADYGYTTPDGTFRFFQGWDAKLKSRLLREARANPPTELSEQAMDTLHQLGWDKMLRTGNPDLVSG